VIVDDFRVWQLQMVDYFPHSESELLTIASVFEKFTLAKQILKLNLKSEEENDSHHLIMMRSTATLLENALS
jgi:hypothetical protein